MSMSKTEPRALVRKEPPMPAPPDFFKPQIRLAIEALVGELSDAIRDVESQNPKEPNQQKRYDRMRAAREAVIVAYEAARS